ncbi:MAG: GTPase Era [Deltaproteobacteria bacterium]|nr:GTPase Era [Deltaproteobacteria bacterium]
MAKLKSGFITLLGLPNAGKSSLLNKLVGEQLAIVTPKAQTTRQLLRGYIVQPDLEAVITDTPGLQEGTTALNAALSKNAARAVALAREGGEIVALMIDAADIGRRLRDKKHLGLEPLKNVLERECGKLPLKLPVLPTFNKADLIRKHEHRAEIEAAVMPLFNELFEKPLKPIWISVPTGEGVGEWLHAVKQALPLGDKGALFDNDALSDQNLREFASEFIREQCFMQLGAEIPYSVAVQIETFDEKDPKITRIEATLHVERDSQKAVVLGAKGSKIKVIGTKAREKIELLIGKKVFLGLKVKVTPHWAREQKWVERFGYGRSK